MEQKTQQWLSTGLLVGAMCLATVAGAAGETTGLTQADLDKINLAVANDFKALVLPAMYALAAVIVGGLIVFGLSVKAAKKAGRG